MIRKRLDRMLGSVTTYRLVSMTLAVLGVYALVLAALGQLAYGWLELLASAAVSLAATVLSSVAFARAFGTRAHVDSALVTGMLLFFILPPSIQPAGLLVLALAGVLASASKYLIAWRGRHILNPAAFGAVVVTVSGLTFSGWWVATAPMLPLVAIGAAAVLHRTRRFPMGLLFLLVAVAIVVVRFTVAGSPLEAALSVALVSLPGIFVAGFLLTEPLTLPPRRWQQLLIAALVAALFSIPFSFGPLSSTPQLALVVGNVVAFFFGQRRGIRLELVAKRRLTPATWELSFRPRSRLSFTPGQYLELDVPHRGADVRGRRRVFSISSAPGDLITVAFTVAERSSSFKRALLELEPGATVHATAVGGDFILPKNPRTPTLLIAGGIGITPFSSQLAHAAATGTERDVVVVYAVRHPDELAYAAELARTSARVVLVAPTEPQTLPERWTYAGSARIDRELIEREVPDAVARAAFVSGPPSLVTDVRGHLRRLGARRTSTDYFSGY
jgi:ferredoxin-NADP reductase